MGDKIEADDVPVSTWETAKLPDFKILIPSEWPEGCTENYGDDAVRRLCTRFHEDADILVPAMREFIETPDQFPKALVRLKALIETFSPSSAECERGFSTMNIVCTDLRNRLAVKNMSSCMFISINGPSLKDFKATKYARLWLSDHRGAFDTRIRKKAVRMCIVIWGFEHRAGSRPEWARGPAGMEKRGDRGSVDPA